MNEPKKETFSVNGYNATVIIPEKTNGRWLWKTEFFYAFDKSEKALCEKGYTRVYFEICDKYGSPQSVELMRLFYNELMKRYPFLNKKGYLLGFSRGGLYAFNFALAYPDCVCGAYFDAPVLDLNSWPRSDPRYGERELVMQVIKEYGLKDENELKNFRSSPVYKLKDYFSLNIPTLLIAGAADRTVKFEENSAIMIDFCRKNILPLTYYVKADGDHHPHSFGNNVGVDMYGIPYPDRFNVYSSEIKDSSPNNLKNVNSNFSLVTDFFEKRRGE